MSSDTTQRLPIGTNGQCPHLEQTDEATLQQLFSKVAAVRSSNRELFEFTHRPITVFRMDPSTGDSEEVGEDAVYREFSEDAQGNFSVVIEGEVGTGKSELCAYLAHQLGDDGRPILHVDKNDDLMSLLSERIPEFYREQFDEELPGASNYQQLRDDIRDTPSTVANNATSGAILNLRSKGYDVSSTGKEEEIREFVEDQLALLVEKGEYAREIKFVSEAEYQQNKFLQIFEDDTTAGDAVQELNTELWREVQSRYDTASIDDVLERVGKRFDDTRPVIVFEDFGITAMEAERLRNYMERDKPLDNWDFIVAGTRDSTNVLHTQTAEDRFEFYRTNEQDSNSVLFLDEDSAVDFIRPYLGYFKSQDGSVSYDRSGDGLALTLQEPADDSLCDECGFCDPSFRDLFPFNELFLQRIYSGLPESQQSPREFVMIVFDVLRNYYDETLTAPSSSDRVGGLDNEVTFGSDLYDYAGPLAKLLRWYGEVQPDGDSVVVDRRFVDVFGILEDDEVVSIESLESVEIIDGTVVASQTGNDVGEEDDDDDDDDDDIGVELTRAERVIDNNRHRVESWLNSPDKQSEVDQYIRLGLEDALSYLTNDYRLFESGDLRYNLSSQKRPFVFSFSAKAPDPDQIVVDVSDFRITGLRALFEFGVYRKEEPRIADYGKLFESIGTQLTTYARRWRQNVAHANLHREGTIFKKKSAYEFADFVLAAYAEAVLVSDPLEEMSAERLNQAYVSDMEYKIDRSLRMALDDELTNDELAAVKKFVGYGEELENLMGSVWGVSESQLDVPAIRDALSKAPPHDVLSHLGRGQIANVDGRVRFDAHNTLKRLADTGYDVRQALDSVIETAYDGDVVETIADDIGDVDVEEISVIIDDLRTYPDVDAGMIESLVKFTQLSNTDVVNAVKAANTARQLENQTELNQLQAALISLQLSESDVYTRYSDIVITGSVGGQEFGTKFREIGGYYVQ